MGRSRVFCGIVVRPLSGMPFVKLVSAAKCFKGGTLTRYSYAANVLVLRYRERVGDRLPYPLAIKNSRSLNDFCRSRDMSVPDSMRHYNSCETSTDLRQTEVLRRY